MKVISVANQKGGVGKTSTAIELGAAIAESGRKVLLIDLDQQHNLSNYIGADLSAPSIYEVLKGETPIKNAIQPVESVEGLFVIPASNKLSKADREFIDTGDPHLLEDVIYLIQTDGSLEFDYIIIDNSPSRSILLTMSYIASDYVIIPTECDSGSLDGVKSIEQDIRKLRGGRHPLSHAEIAAILLTKYEKTQMHSIAEENLREMAPEIVGEPFVRRIRKSISVSEAKLVTKPLLKHMKKAKPAEDYREAVAELMSRIER